jgi:hypothetical protein
MVSALSTTRFDWLEIQEAFVAVPPERPGSKMRMDDKQRIDNRQESLEKQKSRNP